MAEEKETKEETSSNNGGKKYHLIQPNFTMSIVYAAIVCGIELIHSILAACGIGGNLTWMIINIVCAAGEIVVGILALKLFLRETNPKRNEDLASFIISMVAFIIAFVLALWFCIDGTRNIVGFIHELINK